MKLKVVKYRLKIVSQASLKRVINKSTHHPRRTLKEDGLNDVKSEISVVKSKHNPWKCVLLKGFSYKEAK